MISVISGIATMRANDNSNRMQVDNVIEFQKCFFNQTFKDAELILVEQRPVGATASAFDDIIDPRVVHLIVYNDRFNDSWLLNVGAKAAISQLLIFIDADVGYGPTYLEQIVCEFPKSEHPYLHGFSHSYWLSKEGRRRYVEDERSMRDWPMKDAKTDEVLIDRIVEPDIGGNIGLSMIVDRSFYLDTMGGHNESFVEGGGRDNDFGLRVFKEAGMFPIMDYDIVHLWHGGKIQGASNQQLWPFVRKHPELVTEEIKRMGVGYHLYPLNHTVDEWETLAKVENREETASVSHAK